MGHTTLVIHPEDYSTRFLEATYRGIHATVLTGDVERPHVRGLMEKFDQIMMLGHGSPQGLFSVGQFPGYQHVIDATFVDQLRERDNNVFIWCYASDFVLKNQLRGFATGMFVSEVKEADWFNLTAIDTEIQASNHLFANVVGRFVTQHPRVLYAAVDDEYGKLAELNPVAEYNHARIRLFEEEGCCPDGALGAREECVPAHGAPGECIPQQSAGIRT